MDIDTIMDAQFGAVGTPEREAFRTEAYDYCVGQLIAEARKAEKMSLRALASKVGLSTSYLSDIEQGKAEPSASVFLRALDALGLRFDIAKPMPYLMPQV